MARMPIEARDTQTYVIIGAYMEVYTELGCGLLEAAHKQALGIEFERRNIVHSREVLTPVFYKGVQLDCPYRADFVCFGEVIVEIKAMKQLTQVYRARVINYLKPTGFTRALLINFGAASLEGVLLERLMVPRHVRVVRQSLQPRISNHQTSNLQRQTVLFCCVHGPLGRAAGYQFWHPSDAEVGAARAVRGRRAGRGHVAF